MTTGVMWDVHMIQSEASRSQRDILVFTFYFSMLEEIKYSLNFIRDKIGFIIKENSSLLSYV